MKITRTAKLEGLNWSADRWELFSDMPGAEAAAKEMNELLMNSINEGQTRREVERNMADIFSRYSHLGADDSEPRNHLYDLLDKIFGAE